MKIFKKISCLALAAVMALTSVIVAVPSTANAAIDKNLSLDYYSKNLIGVGYASGSSESFYFEDGLTYTIDNIKTSSKDLKAKKTYSYTRDYNYKGSEYTKPYKERSRRYTIGYYAKKAGTYTLSFDIKKGKSKVYTVKIKVKAMEDTSPIKNVRVNGKTPKDDEGNFIGGYETSKKSVKVKFNPKKGVKIKAVYNEYQDSKGEYKDKKVKNGGTFNTSAKKYSYSSTYKYDYSESKYTYEYDKFYSNASARAYYVDKRFCEYTVVKNGKKSVKNGSRTGSYYFGITRI